eukprot:CCRYP_006618-RA/>CCRYP_006618-RA protein AED:0.05 eAED:0.05 QI:5/1/1/1/0.85/0.62/8/2920/792
MQHWLTSNRTFTPAAIRTAKETGIIIMMTTTTTMPSNETKEKEDDHDEIDNVSEDVTTAATRDNQENAATNNESTADTDNVDDDDDYPPITPSILQSLTHEQARRLLHDNNNDNNNYDDNSSSPSPLLTTLQHQIETGAISRAAFWKAVPLSSIPFRLLQGDEFVEARMKKLAGIANKTTSVTRGRVNDITRIPQHPISHPDDTTIRRIQLVLPPPTQPPYYTKSEAVAVLERNAPHMSLAADQMIQRGLVPCQKKRLFQLLAEKKKKRQESKKKSSNNNNNASNDNDNASSDNNDHDDDDADLPDTPWRILPPSKLPPNSTNAALPPETNTLPLLLPPPPHPSHHYTPDETQHFLQNLPPPPHPPHYTKFQTIDLLSRFQSQPQQQRIVMEELIQRELVPVKFGQLYSMMKRIREGVRWDVVASSPWRVRENTTTTTTTTTTRVEEDENGNHVVIVVEGRGQKKRARPSSSQSPITNKKPKGNVYEAFRKGVRSLEDGELVRRVAVELERRGYVLGWKLGVRGEMEVGRRDDKDNDDDDGAGKKKKKKTTTKNSKEKGNDDVASQETKNPTNSKNIHKNNIRRPPPLPPNLVFYPSTTHLPPRLVSKWNDMYTQLQSFHKEHGHVHVPSTNRPLHDWVSRQMSQWNDMQRIGVKHSLSLDRIQKLYAVGFGKEAATTSRGGNAVEAEMKRGVRSDRLWDQRFEELKEFQEIHGTTVVPRHINDLLSKWAYKQRIYCKLIRQGDTTTPLTPERLEKLEEIGFDTSGDFKAVRLDQRKRNKIKGRESMGGEIP